MFWLRFLPCGVFGFAGRLKRFQTACGLKRRLAGFRGVACDIGRGHFYVGVLGAVAQGVIHQHQREHGLGYRRGAQADAGVVAAVGGDFHGLAVDVDRAARCGDAAGGLDGEVGADGLAGGNAAQDAAGVVAQKAFGRELVAVFAAEDNITCCWSQISLIKLEPIL